MENAGISLADIAAVTKDGDWGGNGGAWWIIVLFALMSNGGWGAWNRGSDFGQYATAASQTEILLGQQFQNLDNKIDRIGNGIADATFALNNSIHSAQDSTLVSRYELGSQLADCCCTTNRNIDQSRYDMSLAACSIKENDDKNAQKILDLLYQNKIDALQGKVNQLELQSALCGVVRYPNATTYTAGYNPYFNQGCGCGAGYSFGTTF